MNGWRQEAEITWIYKQSKRSKLKRDSGKGIFEIAPGRREAAVLVLGGPASGSWWPLHLVSMKIQKKNTVTENVHIFRETKCDLYVADPSTRQGGCLMAYKTKILCYKAKIRP
jgi:hypothetical protein